MTQKLLKNDKRHKLAALLDEGLQELSTVENCESIERGKEKIKAIELLDWADYLLENGVTVNPVKAGNPVYFVEFDDETERWEIFESEIMDVCEHGFFIPCCLGAKKNDPLGWDFQRWDDEDTFFSSKEAEEALAERNGKE